MTAPEPPRRGPIAGRITEIVPIPDSDHVHLARVNVGGTSELTIVFGGAPLVREGDLVPVAPPGSWVLGKDGVRQRPVKMRRRRYRGQDSHGMLCSLLELGWHRKSADRVAVLRDVEPGAPLPGPDAWRPVVAEPDPRHLEPNTVELPRADILRLLAPGEDA